MIQSENSKWRCTNADCAALKYDDDAIHCGLCGSEFGRNFNPPYGVPELIPASEAWNQAFSVSEKKEQTRRRDLKEWEQQVMTVVTMEIHSALQVGDMSIEVKFGDLNLRSAKDESEIVPVLVKLRELGYGATPHWTQGRKFTLLVSWEHAAGPEEEE